MKGVPALQKLFYLLFIECAAFALAVGAEITANVRTFIPIEAEPAQGIEYESFRFVRAACLVGVFYAKNELAFVLMREGSIKQGNVGGADMGIASGRRCDSGADWFHLKIGLLVQNVWAGNYTLNPINSHRERGWSALMLHI